jgi:hypothetical protein
MAYLFIEPQLTNDMKFLRSSPGLSWTFYTLTFFIVAFLDIVFIQRDYYHHLGDYSGIFSLGLGWLDGVPYKDFPWPLWGVGQISAGIIALIGLPQSDLALFNYVWVALNISAVLLGGWILAKSLNDMALPPYFAFVLGLVTFTMPIINTGWLYSNPYFFFGVVLGPATVVLINRIYAPRRRLVTYEVVALVFLGFTAANNFGALTVLLAAITTYVFRALNFVFLGKRNLVDEVPASGRWNKLQFWIYVFLGLLFLISISRGLASVSVGLGITFFLFSLAIITSMTFTRFLSRGDHLLVAMMLLGWFLGTNRLSVEYGRVALIARSLSSSVSTGIALPTLLPEISNWNVNSGTYWFWIILVTYLVALMLGVAALFGRISLKRKSLQAMAALFALTMILILQIITGWDFSFPRGFSAMDYGLIDRYLWTILSAIFVVTLVFGATIQLRGLRIILFSTLSAIGVASLIQGYQAKLIMTKRIEVVNVTLDKAIDEHLRAGPTKIVLVANAYNPVRSMYLYSYHNSRAALITKKEDLENGRIKYIGRFGGSMWRSPLELMHANNLSPDDVLIIAEPSTYPPYMEVIEEFTDVRVDLMRIKTNNK